VSVWICIPSARPIAQVNAWAQKWIDQGYLVSLWRDKVENPTPLCHSLTTGPYPGYASAVNLLVKGVLEQDHECDWIVIGGDDVFPDPTKRADEIAEECTEYFVNPHPSRFNPGTFGVMQPTGDRWGAEEVWARARFPDSPAYIDRVAGSAWIGREFCQRAYGGNGPLWHEYFHMFVDEELQQVAEKLGVFWQRRDLTQHHAHWGRDGFTHAAPDFLREANSGGHWAKFQTLFNARKNAGFPGSEVR
jgi:hypothetical protein